MTDIIVAVLTLLSISLFVGMLLVYLNSKKGSTQLIQAELDKVLLMSKIEKMAEELQALETQQSDGFLKFISQSRDWAFDYIEKVQSAIVELNVAMNASDEAKITEAYQGLLKFLPENDPDVVN